MDVPVFHKTIQIKSSLKTMKLMDHIFMGMHNIRLTPPVYWNKDETSLLICFSTRCHGWHSKTRWGEQQFWQHEAVSHCRNHLVSVVEHKSRWNTICLEGNRGEADEVKRRHNSVCVSDCWARNGRPGRISDCTWTQLLVWEIRS